MDDVFEKVIIFVMVSVAVGLLSVIGAVIAQLIMCGCDA